MMSVYIARVRRNGGSLAVNLNREVILALGLKRNDMVVVRVEGQVAVLAKLAPDELARHVERLA